MAGSVHIIVNVTVAATRAGVGRVALLRAGRLGYDTLVIVTESVNVIANITVAATRAGVGCITLLSTGRLSYDTLVIVTKSIHIIVHINVFATLTSICCKTLFSTGGPGYNPLIIVSKLVNIVIIIIIRASYARVYVISTICTIRFYRAYFHAIVSQLITILNFSISTITAYICRYSLFCAAWQFYSYIIYVLSKSQIFCIIITAYATGIGPTALR